MIEVRKVNRRYGSGAAQQSVLKDVLLSIAEGEFVSIVGTSGSGKTTLLNIIGGLDRAWEGEVEVAGHAMGKLGDRALSALRNRKIGFVFQHFHLLEHMTCLENVMLPGFFGGLQGEAAAQRAEETLRKVGLGHKLHERPSSLSGGQKQRVAIARALFNRPALILCDEPTGSLDRDTGLQILEIFRTLNEAEKMTLVIVTHEDHIAQMASRIIRLEDGALVSDGPSQRGQGAA